MEWHIVVLLVLGGIVTGFINTIAGSGSLISLPLFMYLGLPVNVANGTNRLPIVLQTLVASGTLMKKQIFGWRDALIPTIMGIVGAVAGAQLAVDLNEQVMRITIGFLLLVMLVLLLAKPETWVKGKAGHVKPKPWWVQTIIYLMVGMYGGFIQIGIGFFMLAALVLVSGYDLLKANAVKNLVIMAYTIVALVVFIINHQVHYLYGSIMAIGSMTGAYVASHYTVKKGAEFIRKFLIVVIIVASMDLFGLFKWLASLM